MADVFLSYKSEDRWVADLLSALLTADGYTTWYDKRLRGHEDFGSRIELEIEAARVVIAIWSTKWRESRWLRAEAELADSMGKLISVSVDGTPAPLPFMRKRREDLSGWNGSPQDPRVRALLESIRNIAAGTAASTHGTAGVSVDATAARAWILIADSTTSDAYESYLRTHPAAPQTELARDHLRALKRWARVNRENPFELSTFIQTGPFLALGARAKSEMQAAKQKYIEKRVSTVLGSIGWAGPQSALGSFAMLASLPFVWIVAIMVLATPFRLAARGVREMFEAHPSIRIAIEGFVSQALEWIAELDIATGELNVQVVSIWLVASPVGLLALVIVFSLVGQEFKRTWAEIDARVRDYYEHKVSTL